jgi:uncharacterized protein YxjI
VARTCGSKATSWTTSNTIEDDGRRVAEVSKRWFRVRDTYGVEVAPGENDILILATTAVIDTMAHPDR